MEQRNGKTKVQNTIIHIFEDLAKNGEKTITDIVKSTGYHHNTVRSYVEMIEYIQAQRKLILKRTGHSYLVSLEKEWYDIPPTES